MRWSVPVVLTGLLLLSAPVAARVVVVETLPNLGDEAAFQRAKASSVDANKAFSEGDNAGALAHAETAYTGYPNASTALLVATVHGEMGAPEKAFEWCLKARNHKPSESMAATIDAALKKHGAKLGLGVLRVVTSPDGATVTFDGATTAPSGVYVGASKGEHQVAARKAGFAAAQRSVTVEVGALQEVTLGLTELEGLPAQVGWGLLGGGLVVAGVGGLLLGLAASDASEVSKLDPVSMDYGNRYDDLTGSGQTKQTAGWVMVGVGGAALVTGAVLLGLTLSADSDQGDSVAMPTLSPVRGGLLSGLMGRF